MYSLLNYIAATSKELVAGQHSNVVGNSPYIHTDDQHTMTSIDTGLRGYSEDEKRLIGINTISVVTRLALEFEQEEARYLSHFQVISNHLTHAFP